MAEEDDIAALVIDNGSGMCKGKATARCRIGGREATCRRVCIGYHNLDFCMHSRQASLQNHPQIETDTMCPYELMRGAWCMGHSGLLWTLFDNTSPVFISAHIEPDVSYFSDILHPPFLLVPFLSFRFCCPAGFAGDDAPRSVFPSLIGRARQPGIMVRT